MQKIFVNDETSEKYFIESICNRLGVNTDNFEESINRSSFDILFEGNTNCYLFSVLFLAKNDRERKLKIINTMHSFSLNLFTGQYDKIEKNKVLHEKFTYDNFCELVMEQSVETRNYIILSSLFFPSKPNKEDIEFLFPPHIINDISSKNFDMNPFFSKIINHYVSENLQIYERFINEIILLFESRKSFFFTTKHSILNYYKFCFFYNHFCNNDIFKQRLNIIKLNYEISYSLIDNAEKTIEKIESDPENEFYLKTEKAKFLYIKSDYEKLLTLNFPPKILTSDELAIQKFFHLVNCITQKRKETYFFLLKNINQELFEYQLHKEKLRILKNQDDYCIESEIKDMKFVSTHEKIHYIYELTLIFYQRLMFSKLFLIFPHVKNYTTPSFELSEIYFINAKCFFIREDIVNCRLYASNSLKYFNNNNSLKLLIDCDIYEGLKIDFLEDFIMRLKDFTSSEELNFSLGMYYRRQKDYEKAKQSLSLSIKKCDNLINKLLIFQEFQYCLLEEGNISLLSKMYIESSKVIANFGNISLNFAEMFLVLDEKILLMSYLSQIRAVEQPLCVLKRIENITNLNRNIEFLNSGSKLIEYSNNLVLLDIAYKEMNLEKLKLHSNLCIELWKNLNTSDCWKNLSLKEKIPFQYTYALNIKELIENETDDLILISKMFNATYIKIKNREICFIYNATKHVVNCDDIVIFSRTNINYTFEKLYSKGKLFIYKDGIIMNLKTNTLFFIL